MNIELNYNKLRSMIARCEWKFAKTMPFAPHEYIVKEKCPLKMDEFEYFVNMQREHGVKERWGKYNNPLNKGDTTMSYVDEYIHKHLGLKDDDKGFNIELINGRLKEIFDCVGHLERIRNNYACEMMQEWSSRLSADFPECKKVEFIKPENIINIGITIPFESVPDAIAIRIQFEKGKLYYGLTCMPATREKRAELQEAMSFINSDDDFFKGIDWLYYKYTSYKEGYDELKKLIEKMV